MELKQPDILDSEDLRLDNANKKRLSGKQTKTEGKFILKEVEDNPKSLRSDWEKTIADKVQQSPSKTPSEGILKFNELAEKEIRLHIDAEQIHDGVQLDNKSDPLWEPWHDKQPKRELKPQVSPSVENKPSPAPTELKPISLDPALAAEAAMHSQAVANIAREHALEAAAPSYKEQLPKEAQDIMDRLQPAKDHHLEQSAWHNIEINNKTGRAAEQPSFTYGEAFKDEQKAEANSFDHDGAIATASGQLAVSSPILNSVNDADAAILNSSQSAPYTQSSIRDRDVLSRDNYNSIDPVLWIILIVIIFAIFLALIL